MSSVVPTFSRRAARPPGCRASHPVRPAFGQPTSFPRRATAQRGRRSGILRRCHSRSVRGNGRAIRGRRCTCSSASGARTLKTMSAAFQSAARSAINSAPDARYTLVADLRPVARPRFDGHAETLLDQFLDDLGHAGNAPLARNDLSRHPDQQRHSCSPQLRKRVRTRTRPPCYKCSIGCSCIRHAPSYSRAMSQSATAGARIFCDLLPTKTPTWPPGKSSSV